MFCANCGTKNDDGAVFCAGCGQKLEAPVAPAPAPEVAPAPAPATFNELEDEATVAAYFNPATGMTTPVAPAPAPEVAAQPVAPAPAPEVVAQPVAPAPAPEVVAQPVAPAPAPEVVAQPVAPAPAPEMAAQPVAPAPTVAPAPVAPAAPKEKKPVNKAVFIIIGAVAAVLVIAIIIIAAINLGGGSGSKYAGSWHMWYSVEDEVTNIAYGDNIFKDVIDGQAYSESYSMDNSVIVVSNEEEEFFVITNKGKVTSLGEDLSCVNVSQDGSVIAYIDEDDDLYSYAVSNGKANKIAEDVEYVVVSPSGKSFAYVVDDDDVDIMYVYNGKETKLSKNATPIALTDDCKFIYYYDYNKDALYVTNLKDDSNKISSDCDGDYVLNKDHTELMFTTDGGLYVTIKGGDKQKITSKDYTPYYLGIYADQYYHYDSVSGAYTYNLASLKNQYYRCGDAIVFVDKKWSSENVIKNIDDYEVSDDLKTVYYTNENGTLYSCKLDGKYEANKIKSDVTYFDITRDGNSVYFIVDNDSLYYQKGKGDSSKIATDVYSVRVAYDGTAFFLLDYDYDDSTGVLYYSKGGKDKQKVASDVYNYNCYRDINVYYDNYEYESNYDEDTWTYSSSSSYDIYIAKGGTKFKKALESIGYKYSY